MSGDEPRRSGRATKGQHKNASASPGPKSKPATKAKRGKKAAESPTEQEEEGEEDGEEEGGTIRCICGNNEDDDEPAFVACDKCKAWQHNVCMGMPDDDEDLPDQYYCEQCRPEDHAETLEALERGEKIWEVRSKLHQAEKKKKRKSKSSEEKPSWLKRELRDTPTQDEPKTEAKDTGNKRKRSVKEETEQASHDESAAQKPARRQDKRRKADAVVKAEANEDADTALVSIDRLPTDRQKIAQAFSKLMSDVIKEEAKSELKIPAKETADSLAERYASRLEYALHMNHNAKPAYSAQFRTLIANLKKNKTLVANLVTERLTADELSTMSSADMASEELQKERAAMKAEADRQATIEQRNDGPRYRRTHKGDEIVENEAAASSSAPLSRPVRQSVSEIEIAESPVTKTEPSQENEERKASNPAFDYKELVAKTGTTARPVPLTGRRQSSMQAPSNGAKEDADVDRLLADADDDAYSPQDYPVDIVWRGKLVQNPGDLEPTVNARWVAGRDISTTVSWRDLLPAKIVIDGRLQVDKAEAYLCGLQWSSSSDVSVLALTAYDDADAFDSVFTYFQTRGRYAVVNDSRPGLPVKDLYIIPVEAGAASLPTHIERLTHNAIQVPTEERLLLATFVVARDATTTAQPQSNGHHPHYQAQLMAGPAASPIAPSAPAFANQHDPLNSTPVSQEGITKMAIEILGELYTCPVAQQVVSAPGVTKEQLLNMRTIFEQDVATRTDLTALMSHLFGQRA